MHVGKYVKLFLFSGATLEKLDLASVMETRDL